MWTFADNHPWIFFLCIAFVSWGFAWGMPMSFVSIYHCKKEKDDV